MSVRPRDGVVTARTGNDTSEITNAAIWGSQAEICYWAPYSLCGTKRIQKVFISPKIVTHAMRTLPGCAG
ncbi:hypothetical protein EF918_22755 [Streptomyces sp. WAC06614]|nr:hypothetical protein EF918_22755 [Streptomyces sp. WAC06614]